MIWNRMLPTEAAHSFAVTRVMLGVQIMLIKFSLLLLHPLHQTQHLKHSTLCTSHNLPLSISSPWFLISQAISCSWPLGDITSGVFDMKRQWLWCVSQRVLGCYTQQVWPAHIPSPLFLFQNSFFPSLNPPPGTQTLQLLAECWVLDMKGGGVSWDMIDSSLQANNGWKDNVNI